MSERASGTLKVYAERDQCIALCISMAQKLGLPCGLALDEEGFEWPVIVLDLPVGQVSWHVTKEELMTWFPDLPKYEGKVEVLTSIERGRRVVSYDNFPVPV